MATREVLVERYIEQVHDGIKYRGYLKIADVEFYYELVFAFPIALIADTELIEDKNEIRRRFQITVRRDNADIELTNEEYGFFLALVAELAIDFYYNSQTRGSNEGALGMLLSGEGQLDALGMSASIGMTSSGVWGFPPELCEMLSAPKFGCALVA